MSDGGGGIGIDIGAGGAIAVDTASLDHAAAGIDRVGDDLEALRDRADGVLALVVDAARVDDAPVWRAAAVAASLGRAAVRARDLARSLRHAARVYEIVELANERDLARAAGDRSRADAAAGRLAVARSAHPLAAVQADVVASVWRLRWAGGFAETVMSPLGILGPPLASALGLAVPIAVASTGRGVVPRGGIPPGPVPAVTVSPVGAAARPATAPSSLAQLVARVPDGADGARVRVERYAMPDGTQRFTVYVAGTQTVVPGEDPFDMVSNAQLYAGGDAASAEAARQALVAAGVRPGDALDVVGFSQGGAVAAVLAQESTYDVQAVVMAGAPVSGDLAPDVLAISLEHRDDPVVALQGPVDAGMQGSEDSFTATRTVDPAGGAHDVGMPAHRHAEYVRTAALVDQSGDPRTAAIDRMLAGMQAAAEVTATEYSARRP